MSSNRIFTGLAALAAVMLTGLAALAQDHELAGVQIFEPSDVRPYDDWAQPRDGFWFTFDGLFWYISPPKKAPIGDPTITPIVYDNAQNQSIEQNTVDTGQFRATWKLGDRTEFGYIDGHHGFQASIIDMNSQTEFINAAGVPVVFQDPLISATQTRLDIVFPGPPQFIGRAPVVFDTLTVENKTIVSGAEALYVYRPNQLPDGGSLKFFLGARYLQFDDKFWVNGYGGVLDASNVYSAVMNRISGPEIGLAWNKPYGRFSLSAEGRFMAGLNCQAANLQALLASNINLDVGTPPHPAPWPQQLQPMGFNHSADYYEFTPLVEFRVEGHVQLTRLVALKAGWTAMWMNGIGRAADMVQYNVDNMDINPAANRQDVFIQGFNVGLELDH